MADITAAMVKELRERTGSGMMECKKALVETNGDIDAAIDSMRKSGALKAEKKAGRAAAEGMILIRNAKGVAMAVEINCETDFVTKNEDFLSFANEVADLALAAKVKDIDALLALPMRGKTVAEVSKDMIIKIGENITVRRMQILESSHILGAYSHGVRIGVLVEMEGGDESLAKDIAMHVAASSPLCVDASGIPADILAKEREIYTARAQESGKPAEIIAKMVEGSIRKFMEENTLLSQAFVKDPDQTVEKLLKSKGAKVLRFVKLNLGEGVVVEKTDFAAEVMAQAGLK